MEYNFDRDRFIHDVTALVRIKSVNRDKDVTPDSPLGEGVHRAISYVLELGKKMGFPVAADIDGYCGYLEIGHGDEMIGLLTHVDTVPAGDGWTYNPFDATVHEERLYGRGTSDDKGPTIMCLYAMKAIVDSGIFLNKRIRLIFGGDEESGMWTCMQRYKKTEEIPSIAFSPDASYPVLNAEKGIVRISIEGTFTGGTLPLELDSGLKSNVVPAEARAVIGGKTYHAEGKAAHAMAPETGENALIKLCAHLEDDGFSHPFFSLVKIANREGFGIDLCDEPSGMLTITPSIASVHLNTGKLVCDIRYPVTVTRNDVLKRIESRVAELGFHVNFISENPPLFVDRKSDFINVLQKAYREVTHDAREPVGSGACTYARAFPNAVAFGVIMPGVEPAFHKADEYWDISGMKTSFEIYTNALSLLIAGK